LKDTSRKGKLGVGSNWGLGLTGVFSNADLQANIQGRHFYRGLEINTSIQFSAAKEVDSNWSETMNPSFYAESVSGLYSQAYFAARIWRTILQDGSWTGEYTSADTGKGYFAILTFNRFRIKSSTSVRAEGVLTLQAADASMIDLDVAGETRLRAAGKVRGIQVKGAVDGVDMKLISEANGPLGETQIQLRSVRETTLRGTWHGRADGAGALQGSLELARF